MATADPPSRIDRGALRNRTGRRQERWAGDKLDSHERPFQPARQDGRERAEQRHRGHSPGRTRQHKHLTDADRRDFIELKPIPDLTR